MFVIPITKTTPATATSGTMATSQAQMTDPSGLGEAMELSSDIGRQYAPDQDIDFDLDQMQDDPTELNSETMVGDENEIIMDELQEGYQPHDVGMEEEDDENDELMLEEDDERGLDNANNTLDEVIQDAPEDTSHEQQVADEDGLDVPISDRILSVAQSPSVEAPNEQHYEVDFPKNAEIDTSDAANMPEGNSSPQAHPVHKAPTPHDDSTVVGDPSTQTRSFSTTSQTNPSKDPDPSQTDPPRMADNESEDQTDTKPGSDLSISQLHPVTVFYENSEIMLFPPSKSDETNVTYFLRNGEIVDKSLIDLMKAFRDVLGESISEDDEMEIDITYLGLCTSEVSQTQLCVFL